jgi:hypothetical protein
MKISDQTIMLIQMMKEQSREWHDKYIGKLQQINKDENESKILALAANLEKDNEITYVVLQEIIRSVNELYDKIPTENRILSAKSESIDSSSSVMLIREQLTEQETREKRAQKIYE